MKAHGAIPLENFSKNFAFSIWNTSLNLHSFFGIFLTLYVLASSSWHGLHEMVQQLLLLHLLDGVSQIKFDIRFHEFLVEFLFIYWFRYFFSGQKENQNILRMIKIHSKHNLSDLDFFFGNFETFYLNWFTPWIRAYREDVSVCHFLFMMRHFFHILLK